MVKWLHNFLVHIGMAAQFANFMKQFNRYIQKTGIAFKVFRGEEKAAHVCDMPFFFDTGLYNIRFILEAESAVFSVQKMIPYLGVGKVKNVDALVRIDLTNFLEGLMKKQVSGFEISKVSFAGIENTYQASFFWINPPLNANKYLQRLEMLAVNSQKWIQKVQTFREFTQ
jgi:hypothetical protein